MQKTIYYVAMMVVAALVSWPAMACKCAAPKAQEAYEKSDLVVIGKQVSDGLNTQAIGGKADDTPATFMLHDIIKGSIRLAGRIQDREISVERAMDTDQMCQSFLTKTDTPYVLFLLQRPDGRLAFLSDCYAASYAVKDGIVDFRNGQIQVDELKAFFAQEPHNEIREN